MEINLSLTQILFHQQLLHSLPAHSTQYTLHVDRLEAANKHQQEQQEHNSTSSNQQEMFPY